ncbi:MAG: hypothetical protein K2N09_09900, partial [Muribaculaceae bacterium]|nr:hypothetical protein [Muribaculaceae bacterium]
MKRGPYIVFIIIFIVLYAAHINSITLRIISDDSDESLPFSIIRIPNMGALRTDSMGIASINLSEQNIKNILVSSFGHETQNVLIPQDAEDLLEIRLKAVPFRLQETVVKPLKKDKDIVIGRQKHSFGIFNTSYLNIFPEYGIDTLSNRIYQYEPGIKFKAPKGKVNRLNAFGINIQPTDSMIKELTFILQIYDMYGYNHQDTTSVPNLAYPPIKVKYRSELVDKKNKEFRYVLPESIDLPDDCIIIVSLTWYDENNVSFLEGKYLKVLTTNNCLLYKEGNPYKLAFTPFLVKKFPSPYFWELTRYYSPEE